MTKKITNHCHVMHLIFMRICLLVVPFVMIMKSGATSTVWQQLYSAGGLDMALDEDGDGQSNLEESLAGTDPFSAASLFEWELGTITNGDLVLQWSSKRGVCYQVQQSNCLVAGAWEDAGHEVLGTGGKMFHHITENSSAGMFFRIQVRTNISEIFGDYVASDLTDSDHDGVTDLSEFLSGSDPSSMTSKWIVPELKNGQGVTVKWFGVMGKVYTVQRRPLNSGINDWEDHGEAVVGCESGVDIVIFDTGSPTDLYRVIVSDQDSDGDGLTDWEEYTAGYNPFLSKSDPLGEGDVIELGKRSISQNIISLETTRPVVNVTSMESGEFTVKRRGGIGAVTVSYFISGSAYAGVDYEALTGTITIPFGQDSATIQVNPLVSSSVSNDTRTIQLSLLAGSYTFDGVLLETLHLIRDNVINVKDYGAQGDGITDDTASIQSAIDALEADSSYNTLYFPSGRYRLNTRVYSGETRYEDWRILRLGGNDLAGRDIQFKGEPDSVLYSTTSPQRAHILVCIGSFRSLTFEGMSFEKSSQPLSAGISGGADGVSLVSLDSREIKEVKFEACRFVNCHGSVFTYGNGLNRRGKLRLVTFVDCEVLNPYGSNTTNIQNTWGGGQQVAIGAWVETAQYFRNRFEGGGEDMTNHVLAPVGRMKDGSHFGSPRNLIFKNNLVLRMAVESVFHVNSLGFMGTTISSILVPPNDGVTTGVVTIREDSDTDFTADQVIMIREGATAYTLGQNYFFKVVSYDPATRDLTLVYEGDAVYTGTTITGNKSIYLQEYDPGYSDISENIVDCTLPPGAEMTTRVSGILAESKGKIMNNVVIGAADGIQVYSDVHTPLYPASDGLIIMGNYIRTRNPIGAYGATTKGINSAANRSVIVGNTIIGQGSQRFVGISMNGQNSHILRNRMIALEKIVNGYSSSNRAVGIFLNNQSLYTVVSGNFTKNFDVGVGPNPNQGGVLHYVDSHESEGDTLGVDPHGVVVP